MLELEDLNNQISPFQTDDIPPSRSKMTDKKGEKGERGERVSINISFFIVYNVSVAILPKILHSNVMIQNVKKDLGRIFKKLVHLKSAIMRIFSKKSRWLTLEFISRGQISCVIPRCALKFQGSWKH